MKNAVQALNRACTAAAARSGLGGGLRTKRAAVRALLRVRTAARGPQGVGGAPLIERAAVRPFEGSNGGGELLRAEGSRRGVSRASVGPLGPIEPPFAPY